MRNFPPIELQLKKGGGDGACRKRLEIAANQLSKKFFLPSRCGTEQKISHFLSFLTFGGKGENAFANLFSPPAAGPPA